jgi:hypothetical protein
MKTEEIDSGSSNDRLDAVLAACIEALDRREADPQQLIARHPELAGELRQFFANAAHVKRMAAPLLHRRL